MATETEIHLARKLSPLNVGALAFGCIIGWGAFVMPGNTFLEKAGPAGTAIGMALASLIMIVIALNYHYMIRKFPVTGGEFAYANEAFGKKNAFICAWFLGLSYLTIVPLNATALALIGRNLMNNIFQIGFHYSVAGYDIYLGEILLAVAALVIFAISSIRGVKAVGVIQNILVFMLVGGAGIVTVATFLSDKASFANISNPAFAPGVSPLAGILGVVAIAPWAFVGFDTIPQAVEEIDFPERKTRFIMIGSIIFGGLVYVALNTITAMVVPAGYDSWDTYIAVHKNLNGLEALPTFHVAYLVLGKTGLILIGLAVTGAILSGIMGFYMATSRLLYSMANAGVLPTAFNALHPKYKTPVYSILFILVISLVAPFFGRTALGWIVDMSSIGAAIGYGYTSAAALKFAYAEKRIGLVITGILGVILAAIFAILLLIPIPGLNTSLGKESYSCLIIWIVLGIVFALVSRKKKAE